MFTLVYKDEAKYPACAYKTARAAKIAATKLGYDMICQVSQQSYSCYDFEQKINGKWQKNRLTA